MRILIAFGHDYLAYRGVLATAIRILRPHLEVETTSLAALGERIARFAPELVICGEQKAAHLGGWPAWVELSVNPLQPAKVWVVGRYSERSNPTVEELLAVIDEVEELIPANDELEGY